MFKKLLIANRGEIACRIISTAKRLGMHCIAVYSTVDADALHVEHADEAYLLGPSAARDSYLNMERILNICRQSGAEAVHPGYGFLSENAEFARKLHEAGIRFVGPSSQSIAAMGDKISSRRLAAKAGVPVIPGWDNPLTSEDEAVEKARQLGYPAMLKASAGGGGKGLRVVSDDDSCRLGFASCRSEAAKAFGDDRVFVEKFIEQPRHIEIQILGDQHSNRVFLWERECSIQRRHQKVIEEAPSPFLDQASRVLMGEAALKLAGAVNYYSAGTVEFVVGKDRNFYFLEMNTRLQVEHGITELITGVDIVEQMLRVADGEKLPFAQKDIPLKGWAVECRINAEDPLKDSLPSRGRLTYFRPPAQITDRLRVDTGVVEGDEISIYYDSMIAKLMTHGDTRGEAIALMQDAVDNFVIRGLGHNLQLQAALLCHPAFAAAALHTGFLTEHWPMGFARQMVQEIPADPRRILLLAATLYHHVGLMRDRQISGQTTGLPWHATQEWVVILDGIHHEVRVEPPRGGVFTLWLDGTAYLLQSHTALGALVLSGSCRKAENGGCEEFSVQVERQGIGYRLSYRGWVVTAQVVTALTAELIKRLPLKKISDTSLFLLSPMPGLLTRIYVEAHQAVKVGQPLVAIEAMKMENILKAEHDVVVEAVLVTPGASVAVDEPLLKFI